MLAAGWNAWISDMRKRPRLYAGLFLAAFAIDITFWGFVAMIRNPTIPFVPWAETNQGLLSLLALAIALFFAVWENARVLRADHSRINEYIDIADAVISEVELLRRTQFQYIRDTGDSETGLRMYEEGVIAPRFVISTLANSTPADAPLAIEMQDILRRLSRSLSDGWPNQDEALARLSDLESALATTRQILVARRR
jgi:hypothetical protein